MPDYLGDDMRKTKDDKEEEKEIKGMNIIFRLFDNLVYKCLQKQAQLGI